MRTLERLLPVHGLGVVDHRGDVLVLEAGLQGIAVEALWKLHRVLGPRAAEPLRDLRQDEAASGENLAV